MKTATKKSQPKKITNEKFRVKQNLSLRGKDLMSRLNNRTLLFKEPTNHSLDPKVDDIRRMSKIDIARESLLNSKNISDQMRKLDKINEDEGQARKQAEREQIKNKAIEEYKNSQTKTETK